MVFVYPYYSAALHTQIHCVQSEVMLAKGLFLSTGEV